MCHVVLHVEHTPSKDTVTTERVTQLAVTSLHLDTYEKRKREEMMMISLPLRNPNPPPPPVPSLALSIAPIAN